MAKRWKVRRRRIARMLLATTGDGNGNGGNGNGNGGNGNGNGGNGGNGNGNGEPEGILPEIPSVIPDPPPGVYEAPTPERPIVRIDEELAKTLKPGGVWPRPEGEIQGTFLVLGAVPHGDKMRWRFFVVDPDAIKEPVEPAPLRK